jgi:hypothetical protein
VTITPPEPGAAAPEPAHEGKYGTATPIHFNPTSPGFAWTVAYWLLDAGIYHPHWDQYVVWVVRLTNVHDDVPDAPPPVKHFPGATHELVVAALDPRSGRVTAEGLAAVAPPALHPVNIVEQFTATDDEAFAIARLAAVAVVHGHINPELGDAPQYVSAGWHQAITNTLALLRHQAGLR